MRCVSSLLYYTGVAFVVALHCQYAVAFEDTFDDGNDEGWTHFDPLAEIQLAEAAPLKFENGFFLMEANPPGADPAGPARIFSYIDGEVLTDFYCAVDIVDWNDSINQAFGILGRVGNIALGKTTGYVCNYDPNQTSGQPGGQFQINRVVDEASDPTIARANIKLLEDHDYRMVFRGEGNRLIGALYDLQDLTAPIVQIETDGDQDPNATTYTEGLLGLFSFYRDDDLTEPHAKPSVTFDNFISVESNPAPELLPGIARGVSSEAQVVRHTPTSRATFHTAAAGVQFEIVPNDQPLPLSIEFYLNNVLVPEDDVTISTEDGVIKGAYQGLNPNQVYEARVEMGDIVSLWQFDTFEESLMESGEAIVVEAEDYNFGAGQFLDQPTAGGVNEAGVPLPNGDSSYYERGAELEIDYHDTDGAPVNDNDYRPDDFVGLRSGSQDIEPGNLVRDISRKRHQLTGALDYEIYQTEAGEWLNYTRTFPKGDYHVYLRAGSQAAQDVLLDRVTGDRTTANQSTEPIGRFALKNQVSRFAWRFTQLTNPDGSPISLSLEGEMTLRLTMGGEADAFEFRRVLALNYLLFVPANQDDPNLVVARGGLFGDVVGPESASLRFLNSGSAEPLTIGDVKIEGEDAAHYTFSQPPASLLPGESASVDIAFDPQNREGVFLAELVVNSNDEGTPEIRVDLSATVEVSSGLLVHYPFDDTDGETIAKDTSGNRRDATYVSTGGATVSLNQPALASGTAVRLSNNGQGEGASAYIEIPNSARLPSLESMTASLWFSQDAGATNVTILSKGLEPADPFAVAMDQGSFAWGAAGESVFQTEIVVTANSPHHWVLRYQSGEVTMFLDGSMIGEPMAGPEFNDQSPTTLLIGALSGGVLGFTGVLDDFQLYSRALAEDEIQFLNENPGQAIGNDPPVDDQPSTTRIETAEDGTQRLTILGPEGRNYTLEVSDTLRADSWIVLREVNGAEATQIVDLETGDAATRFYRLRY